MLRQMKRATYLLPAVFAIALGASNARAHVRLLEPLPRVDGEVGVDQLKNAPCGQADNGRTDIIATFAPGETITVRWAEYIDHPSYYRIAFDADGDDSFPLRPNMSVMQTGDDPSSINPVSDINQMLDVYILQYFMDDVQTPTGSETEYTTTVTLPDIECDNCTLQLIQFMYGRAEPYYFQCADIALRGSAMGAGGSTSGATTATGAGGMMLTTGMGDATSSMSGVTGTSSMGGAGATVTNSDGTTAMTAMTTGSTASVTTGDGSATMGGPATATVNGVGATSAGLGGSSGTTMNPADAGTEGDTGCACRAAPNSHSSAWLGLLLGIVGLGYRRRTERGTRDL